MTRRIERRSEMMLFWLSITPFDVPVVPEVNRMQLGNSGSMTVKG